MSLVALILMTGVAAPAAPAEPVAPFGLTWGQSRAEVEAAGVTLADCVVRGTVETCLAADLQDGFEAAGTYRLFFSTETGLATIRFASDRVSPDRRGLEGRAIYEELRVRLSETHGEARRREQIFRAPPYQLETQFYACLRHGPRCGVWSAEWRGQGISLELRASALSEGEGGYVDLVIYGPG